MKNQQNTGPEPYFLEPEEDSGLDIQEYISVIRKHRKIVLFSLLLCVLLVVFWSYTTTPIYRATALIVVDKQTSRSPITGEIMNYESYFTETARFKTHAKLLTSHAVLEKVVTKLGLSDQSPQPQQDVSAFRNFLQQIKKSIRLKENIDLIAGTEKEKTMPGSKLENAINRLKSSIKVNEVRDTMLYEISIEHPDPVFARDAANSLAHSYIEFDIANRVKYSQNSFQWMSDQFYEVKKKLEDTERDFLNYKEKEKLFSVQGRQDEILHKIREANNSYLETRNERLQAEAKLKELDALSGGGKIDIRPAISQLDSPLLNSLYNQLIETELEKTRLSKVFKAKHPKMIQVNSKIENIYEKIHEEVSKEKAILEANLTTLRTREEVYQQTAADYEDEALAINRKQLQYTILERDVQTNQRLHDTLLAKLKEADITDTLVVSNIRVAEEATMPQSPFKPNKKRNLLLSMIVGLMLGIGLAFLRENIDRTIHTEEDVERALGLTVLSIIPKAEKAVGDGYGKGKD